MATCRELFMVNYLGIDFGRKKIGTALAPESRLALGFLNLPNDKNLFEKLAQIIEEHEISLILVGLPLNLDGTKSKETREAEEFTSKLKQKFSKIKIATHDERFSTIEARKNLPGKNLDDAEAARIILQSYLDKKRKR